MAVTYKTKVGSGRMHPLAFFAMLIILLNAYCCGAAVIVKSNSSFQCSDRLDECLFEEDLELEFLMNPYISRMLGTDPKPSKISYKSNGRGQVFTCGQLHDSPAYQSCIAKFKSNPHLCQTGNVFKRC